MGFKTEGLKDEEAWSANTLMGVGWHDVTIISAEDDTSSGGYPQVNLKFENDQGEDISDWPVYTDNSKGKFVAILDAVGIPVGEDADWEFPTEQLQGKRCRIKVGEEPDFNDPTKNRRRVQGYTQPKTAAGASAGQPAAKPEDDLPF
jgi:hypothetical protein